MSDSPNVKETKEEPRTINLEDMYALMVAMNEKLNKLDSIEGQIHEMKVELNEVKRSVEYAHEEIGDLKSESERKVKVEKATAEHIEKLEHENVKLHNAVIGRIYIRRRFKRLEELNVLY